MANGRSITNQDIYDRLDRLRVEVTKRIDDTSRDHKNELSDLRRQFETLEAGRLTRAEGRIQDIQLSLQRIGDNTSSVDKQFSGRFVALGAIGMTLLASFLSALFLWFFTRGGK